MFPCFRLTVSTIHTDCFHVSDSYTNIADGFRKANEMFDVSRGDRPAIRDLVVLITDGEANKEASKTITEVTIIARNGLRQSWFNVVPASRCSFEFDMGKYSTRSTCAVLSHIARKVNHVCIFSHDQVTLSHDIIPPYIVHNLHLECDMV